MNNPKASVPVLEIDGLSIGFGGLSALSEFSLKVNQGEIAGLIGPNGAGKTTVFNLITGVYPPTQGQIRLGDTDLKGKSPFRRSRMGIARTFQNIRLFKGVSVLENVKTGLDHETRYSLPDALLRLPAFWKGERSADKRALELLSIFDMQNMAGALAGSLSYGAQRRLEIVRALATGPKLLLLDEPAAGMNPSETAELMENIRRIRDMFGVAILLIEHDMNLVMGVCERITVLNYGRVISSGTPGEVRGDTGVIEAYLGRDGGMAAC